jgi:hypothetical protein
LYQYTIPKSNGKTNYDKDKYRELILDAAETVLGYFGFDRNLYSDKKKMSKRKWWWLEELRQERERDIKIETTEK